MTLTEFLEARITEDEDLARNAAKFEYGCDADVCDDGAWEVADGGKRIDGEHMTIYDEGGHSAYQAEHIARWDPARVLAECEVKRQIIDALVPIATYLWLATPPAKHVLEILALLYADHEDYRPEWRP